MVDTCIYEVASNYICVGINKAMVGVVVIISARSIKPMGDSGGSVLLTRGGRMDERLI